jgi:hypothetical protein
MKFPAPLTREPCEPDIGSPEDWDRIEKALGFKDFDPRRREHLWRSLDLIDLLYFRHDDIPDVRPANTLRALAALKRHAVRLFVDLAPSGRLGRDSFLREQPILDAEAAPADPELNELDLWALAFLSVEIVSPGTRKALLEGLAELMSAVDQAAEGLPKDKGGRGTDWRTKGAIRELARLYTEMSGKTPGLSRSPERAKPGGPFFRFVKVCLQTYAPKPVTSDEALAKTIQRVLRTKKWRMRIAIT